MMKRMALMLAGAGMFVIAPAMAQTVNLGFNGTFGLSSGLGPINAPVTLSGTATLADILNGSPVTINNFTGTASVLGQTDNFNFGTGLATFTNSTLNIYDSPIANPSTLLGTFSLSAPFSKTRTSTTGTLVAGAQNLSFLGFGAVGLQSGSGTFSYSIATPAVPEPASWAMLILGMGAVGYTLRRKVRASEVKFDAKIKRIAAGEIA